MKHSHVKDENFHKIKLKKIKLCKIFHNLTINAMKLLVFLVFIKLIKIIQVK